MMQADFLDENGNKITSDTVTLVYCSDDQERMVAQAWVLYLRDGTATDENRYRAVALAEYDPVAESWLQGEPLEHLNVVCIQEQD